MYKFLPLYYEIFQDHPFTCTIYKSNVIIYKFTFYIDGYYDNIQTSASNIGEKLNYSNKLMNILCKIVYEIKKYGEELETKFNDYINTMGKIKTISVSDIISQSLYYYSKIDLYNPFLKDTYMCKKVTSFRTKNINKYIFISKEDKDDFEYTLNDFIKADSYLENFKRK